MVHLRRPNQPGDVLPGYRSFGRQPNKRSNSKRNALMLVAATAAACVMVFLITGGLGRSAVTQQHEEAAAPADMPQHADEQLAAATEAAAAAAAAALHSNHAGSTRQAEDGSVAVDTAAAAAAAAATAAHHGGTLPPAPSLMVQRSPPTAAEHEASSSDGGQRTAQHQLPAPGVFALSATDIRGRERPLAEFAGSKATIFVNVASKCGFTDSNYKGLQQLYERFKGSGLEVLAFPCNQFGAQEPGSSEEIEAFCTSHYHVTFPLFAKIDVNGPGAHPVYKYLKQHLGVDNLGWNFQKIIVGSDGRPVRLITAEWDQAVVEAAVQELLAAAGAASV